MIPGVNIAGKISIASINKAGGSEKGRGCSETLSRDFRGQRLLGSKEHLDWLKINSNVAKIITVQDYEHTKT